MNLLDMITSQAGGGLVRQMAKELGLSEPQALDAVRDMTPALSRGMQRNLSKPGGLESLIGALGSGNHRRYVEHPEELAGRASVDDGNRILGHILGSKDVSRNVAGRAAQDTGIGASVLKKMLPMLAAAAMGMLSQKSSGGRELSGLGAQGSSPLDMLSGVLDADRDGSALDDLLELGKRFF